MNTTLSEICTHISDSRKIALDAIGGCAIVGHQMERQMANTAWITVEVAISTDCNSNRGVDRDMALYIIPAMEQAVGAIQMIKLVRTEEILDETGRAIFKILPYRLEGC